MQMPTHLIAGALIQIIIEISLPDPTLIWLKISLIIIVAFFSHFFIDASAKATYHPPKPLKDDCFWVWYHVFVYSSAVVIIIILFPWFWLGMLAANAVDLWDWYFLRPMANKKENPDWGKKYRLHPIADFIRRKIFFFLPDLGHDRKGAIPEIVLVVAFFLLLLLMFFNR